MRRSHARWVLPAVLAGTLIVGGLLAPEADSMCGYFRPVIVDVKNPTQVLQPAQIAFITWDPETKTESVTVQPRFEGNARDFAMVIPTPSQPKLHEMPRDFFKALEVYTTPKKRAFPASKLAPWLTMRDFGGRLGGPQKAGGKKGGDDNAPEDVARPSTVLVREVGQVGNLDYKIITADRPDDLTTWLKDNKYSYAGDEATLDYYVQKKYFFTVMKIDALQMKKNKDGTYTGDVTPTRFTFKSDKLVYPTRITQVSVKDKTDAMFYVQAPTKFDLPGDMSYQYQWVSMLQAVQNSMGPDELGEASREWLSKIEPNDVLKRGGELGFLFAGVRQQGNKSPTTLNWAKKLTADDIGILAGTSPYSEKVPDLDDGFTAADMRDPQMNQAIVRVIQKRLQESQRNRPRGYLVRDASADDLKLLPVLKGHLQEGQYLTCFRHEFTRAEMADDLVLVPARVGEVADVSEHENLLRMMIRGGRGGKGGFPPDFKVPGPGLE